MATKKLGRPRTGESPPMTARIPEVLQEEIARRAEQQGVTAADVSRGLILESLRPELFRGTA